MAVYNERTNQVTGSVDWITEGEPEIHTIVDLDTIPGGHQRNLFGIRLDKTPQPGTLTIYEYLGGEQESESGSGSTSDSESASASSESESTEEDLGAEFTEATVNDWPPGPGEFIASYKDDIVYFNTADAGKDVYLFPYSFRNSPTSRANLRSLLVSEATQIIQDALESTSAVLNGGGVSRIDAGLLSNREDAPGFGTGFFYATDTGSFYYSDGITWVPAEGEPIGGRAYGYNGFGSGSNQISRFDTVERNEGNMFADSVSDGASLTIPISGNYAISASGQTGAGLIEYGLSRNASSLVTAFSGLSESSQIAHGYNRASSGSAAGFVAVFTGYLTQGDVVRLHGNRSQACTRWDLSWARI